MLFSSGELVTDRYAHLYSNESSIQDTVDVSSQDIELVVTKGAYCSWLYLYKIRYESCYSVYHLCLCQAIHLQQNFLSSYMLSSQVSHGLHVCMPYRNHCLQ